MADHRSQIQQRIDAGDTPDPHALLLGALVRWESHPSDTDAQVHASLRHVEAFALAAIAVELRELRLRPPRVHVAGDVNTYPGPTG